MKASVDLYKTQHSEIVAYAARVLLGAASHYCAYGAGRHRAVHRDGRVVKAPTVQDVLDGYISWTRGRRKLNRTPSLIARYVLADWEDYLSKLPALPAEGRTS